LVDKMNDGYIPYNLTHQETALLVNNAFAKFIAENAPDQTFSPLQLSPPPLDIQILFPYCRGFCAGKKAHVMTKEGDLYTPTTTAHEFANNLGHGKEIEAEVLGYLIPKQSGVPELQRSADLLRLSRQAWATNITDLLDCNLRDEIKDEIRYSRQLTPYQKFMQNATSLFLMALLKKGGSKLSDYREGFTNFLYTAGIEID